MTAHHTVETLARDLYERYNTALRWIEPDWNFLPEAARAVWRQTVTPKLLERLEDTAKLAYIRYFTSENPLEGFTAWDGLGNAERRRWRAVIAPFMVWEE